ncbi:MAG: hypothetical protein AVDCRST_MAG02-655, partial [uncultured Rubrobacteraceae bacterium]
WLSKTTWSPRWWWPLRRPRRSFRRGCVGCCGAVRSTGWRGCSGPGTRSLRRPRPSARAPSRPPPRPRARSRTWPGRQGRPRRAPRPREATKTNPG